jgi:hypothetical protein
MTKGQMRRIEKLEKRVPEFALLYLRNVSSPDLRRLEDHLLARVVLDYRTRGARYLPTEIRRMLEERTKPISSYLLPERTLRALLKPALVPPPRIPRPRVVSGGKDARLRMPLKVEEAAQRSVSA